MKSKKLTRILVLILILCLCPVPKVAAASSIKLNYDGKTVTYKDKQVSYYLDGKQISLKKTPGVIFNGISLVSYKEVFGTAMGATCNYDSKKGTIRISKFGNTIEMTIGSRTAYVNGKKKTLSIAPKKIKYVDANTTKITVPARNVAEALGYTYTWYSSKSKVEIKSPYQISYGNKWRLYTGAQGKVTVNGKNINVKSMPSVTIDNTCLIQASVVFSSKSVGGTYKYDSSTKKVTIKRNDTTIVYTLNSKTATVNGKKHTLKTAPRMIKDNVSNKARVMVPAEFTAEKLGLQYKWDSKTKTSVITTENAVSTETPKPTQEPEVTEKPEVTQTPEPTSTPEPEGPVLYGQWDGEQVQINEPYNNALQSVRAYRESSKDIIELTAIQTITASFSEDSVNSNIIYIDMEWMENPVGNLYVQLQESNYIENLSVSYLSDTTLRVKIEKKDGSSYYTSQSGNVYSISFSTENNNGVTTPTPMPTQNPNQTVAGSSVSIPKPSGVSINQITDEDLYLEKKIKITVPNDQIDFYNNNPITVLNNSLYVTYERNTQGNTDIIITTPKIQGYKIEETTNAFSVVIDDPKKIYNKIVVLDAGHGGSAPGTDQSNVIEKNVTHDILYTYGKQYFDGENSSIKAYWVRTGDTDVSLADRAAFASKVDADIFVSLHMNSVEGAPAANGTETYYSTTNNKPNDMNLTSQKLATYIQSKLPDALGLSSSRGVKTANFQVTKTNTVPAVLIELGFFTNASDFAKLSNPSFQNNAAKQLHLILEEVFELYPTPR